MLIQTHIHKKEPHSTRQPKQLASLCFLVSWLFQCTVAVSQIPEILVTEDGPLQIVSVQSEFIFMWLLASRELLKHSLFALVFNHAILLEM